MFHPQLIKNTVSFYVDCSFSTFPCLWVLEGLRAFGDAVKEQLMGAGMMFSLVGLTCVPCSHFCVVMSEHRLGAQGETSPMHSGNPERPFIAHRCWPSGVTYRG